MNYTESTITDVFNVFTGDNPGLGDYEDLDGEVFSMGSLISSSNKLHQR
jgi:hypothetical protein